jgi:hypothetical protein
MEDYESECLRALMDEKLTDCWEGEGWSKRDTECWQWGGFDTEQIE